MPDLDMMGGGMPQKPDNHEASMARADLYKCANYSFKLFKMIQDGQELEGWVQAKITKAADYIASVYHYMEYEMKFNEYGQKLENSDIYTESVKQQYIQKLTEARVKLEKLKEKNKKDLDEEVDKSKIPAALRKAKGGDWRVSKADLDKEASKSPTSKAGLEKRKQELGMKEALKGGQKKLDVDKDGKLEKSDFAKLRSSKGVKEASHQEKTTMKHVNASDASPKVKAAIAQAAKRIKPGIKGYGDRAAALRAAGIEDDRLKEGSKPDFLDMDKDGNKKEPMKKAVADKKKNPFAKKTDESIVAEKAVSKAQQKFMGMVHATKKGEKPASKEVAKVAKGMSATAAKDYASTKHKGLPAKKS